ncbi:hypothetical protein GCM10028777_37460 [Angustibacter speluncae]
MIFFTGCSRGCVGGVGPGLPRGAARARSGWSRRPVRLIPRIDEPRTDDSAPADRSTPRSTALARPTHQEHPMSFQAYLDTIEDRTGLTPRELLAQAEAAGFGPTSKAGDVAAWLKDTHGIGRGHAMAFFHVLKNGPTISDKHVGTTGTHRDASTELLLDGKAARGS